MFEKRVVDFAKVFIVALFSDGKVRQPTDLDNELLGGLDPQMFSVLGPTLNRSVFGIAIGLLVKDGVMSVSHDKDGWRYWLTPMSERKS